MIINRIKTAGILALLVVAISPVAAFAEWKIYFTGGAARMFGSAGRGSFATRAECEAYRASSAAYERNNCYCAGSDSASASGASTGFQGPPEQQFALGLLDGLLKSIFAKPDTSRQDEINRQNAEIERQNALMRQQEEEQRKQAANQAWIDLQNQEKEQRKIAEADKKAAGQDLLGKIETVGGGELELKTLGTDFFQGGAVDLRGKQGTVQSLTTREEQAQRDLWYEEQIQGQGFSDLAPIPENGITESAGSVSKLEDSKEYKMVDFYLDRIEKVPLGELPAYVGKIMLNFENHAFVSINATTAAILNGSPPPEAVANGTVVQNIIYKTAESMTIDKAVDIGKKIAANSGIGFLSAVYGRATEATTTLALEVSEDTKKIVEIWFAKRY